MLQASRANRHYRSRLEILRDFLGAVRETGTKTHIIGLANLNPASYHKYLDFCLSLQLVEDTPAGYRLTPRAAVVLEVIQRLLARSADVDAALVDLHRGFDRSYLSGPSTGGALRSVSILAWNEVVQSAAHSLRAATEPAEDGHPVDLLSAKTPAWLGRIGAGEPEGSVLTREVLPEPDLPRRSTPVSARPRT
jgi:predicted transcriptional regulator